MTDKPEGISFSCPYCRRRLRVAATSAGRKVLCPNVDCRKTIVVPVVVPQVASNHDSSFDDPLAAAIQPQAQSNPPQTLPKKRRSLWAALSIGTVALAAVGGGLALFHASGAATKQPLASSNQNATSDAEAERVLRADLMGKTDKEDEEPKLLLPLIREGGFGERPLLWRDLPAWVRFGTKQVADRHHRGDQFEKIDIEKETEAHRAFVDETVLRLDGLPVKLTVPKDVEDAGMFAEIELPMRVMAPQSVSNRYSGLVGWIHGSVVDMSKFAFLTKDGGLTDCSPAEANAVTRRGGVLYQPECGKSTLIVNVRGDLETLRDVARNNKDYSFRIDVLGLGFARPGAWGYYRRDALLAAKGDCRRILLDSLKDPKNPQPLYYATAVATDEHNPCPEIVGASRLLRLELVRSDGICVGGYDVRDKAPANAAATKKQPPRFALRPNGVEANGVLLPFPLTLARLQQVLGPITRKVPLEFTSNYIWDELGVVAVAKDDVVLGLTFAFKRNERLDAPCHRFRGEVEIEGKRLDRYSTYRGLRGAGFSTSDGGKTYLFEVGKTKVMANMAEVRPAQLQLMSTEGL